MNELSLMINPKPHVLTTADLAQLTGHIMEDITPKRIDFYNLYPADHIVERQVHVRVLLEDFSDPSTAQDMMKEYGEAASVALNAITGCQVKVRTGSDGYQVSLELLVQDFDTQQPQI